MTALDAIRKLVAWDTGIGSGLQVRGAQPFAGPVPSSHADLFTRVPAADWAITGDTVRLQAAARLCVTVYACATYLADAVAESPLRVYRVVDGELEEDSKHRARVLIAQPNPYMSEAELMTLIVMTMAFTGYAVIEKVRSNAGLPVELWPLRPDWLDRERTNDGVGRWVYRVPGVEPRIVDRDDLLIVPYRHDDRQERLGISPVHVAAREVGIDSSLTDLLKIFLDGGGIPPFMIEVPDALPDQADLDVFRLKWDQQYGGSKAYGRPGLLYGGMKVHKIGDGINDMAWPDLRGLTELKIAQAFRVPAELIQARDSLQSGGLETTRAQGSMQQLQRFGAAPLRTRIDGAFTRGLLADFTGGDPTYTIEFDTSAVLSLQEDTDALHMRVRADYQAGILTLNEARVETQRPDLGVDGDVFAVPFSLTFLRAGELAVSADAPLPKAAITATPPRAIAAQVRRYRDTKALDPAALELRAATIRTAQRDRQRLTDIGARKLRAFFAGQKERVIAGLPGKTADGVEAKDAMRDWGDEEDRLRAVLTPLHEQSGKAAYGAAADLLGVDLSWDLSNPNIRRVMEELGLRIVDINETTRQDVVRVVTAGADDGLGVDDIAKTLTDLFEQTYAGRAETVARTETMTSYNLASTLGYEESGVVEEVELLDNSSHTEGYGASDGLSCAERDGLIVNLADVGRHVEAEHPNGQLSVAPILATPLGE